MISFLKTTFQEFSQDSCTRMAAALAYFTVFALPPLFVILLMVLGAWYSATGQGGEEAARQKMQQQIAEFVGPGAQEEVTQIIENASLEQGSVWRWGLS